MKACALAPPPSRQSYLHIPAILSAADITGADAIHPGFGFLSENAHFAEMVAAHGMTFIGPKPHHIHTMGQKALAKQTARQLGLTVVAGSDGEVHNAQEALDIAQSIGFPVLLKATAGGGGKGMRVVHQAQDVASLFDQAQTEALANFGYGGMYIEQFLQKPRHIEFQVLGDLFGHVICLGDRECSVQRNHQKIWEEAPASILSPDQRADMMQKIVHAMSAFQYSSLGTLEFLYENGNFYFIEMNTRVQVEHPVTEMITGIDLVKEQIRLAQGAPLTLRQSDVQLTGHAIECRINAENPLTFFPSPGRVETHIPPGGPFIRVDSALFPGYQVPPYYDSLVGKLIAYGAHRDECLARLYRALQEYVITGIETLIPLHMALCQHPDIIHNRLYVKWIEQVYLPSLAAPAGS